jgi:hypothetical protein
MGNYRREGVKTSTISAGGTESTAICTEGFAGFSLLIPPAWDAGDLFVQGSCDGKNFADIYDDDGTVIKIADATMQLALGKWVSLATVAASVFPFKYLRLRSQNAQGAERVFVLMMRS